MEGEGSVMGLVRKMAGAVGRELQGKEEEIRGLGGLLYSLTLTTEALERRLDLHQQVRPLPPPTHAPTPARSLACAPAATREKMLVLRRSFAQRERVCVTSARALFLHSLCNCLSRIC